ncbi:MAG: PAS domain-containing protein, partial [Desulfobulbaceae bacterium]|nr:PAS domain-containing protein [Desulfobulbaceae bacterium]
MKQNPKIPDAHLKMDTEALLQTLLHELQDGVIVCDPDGKITLFNQAAADLFGDSQAISSGDSLYTLCLQSPVKHALNLLQYQLQDKKNGPGNHPYIQFMNATTSQGKF